MRRWKSLLVQWTEPRAFPTQQLVWRNGLGRTEWSGVDFLNLLLNFFIWLFGASHSVRHTAETVQPSSKTVSLWPSTQRLWTIACEIENEGVLRLVTVCFRGGHSLSGRKSLPVCIVFLSFCSNNNLSTIHLESKPLGNWIRVFLKAMTKISSNRVFGYFPIIFNKKLPAIVPRRRVLAGSEGSVRTKLIKLQFKRITQGSV